MQKKCIKKKKTKAAGQKECISKSKKHAKGSNSKKANKTKKKPNKRTCTTKFHTPPFLCDVFSMFVHFMCDLFAFVVRFWCIFLNGLFVFSQGNAQKMQKKIAKQHKYKAKTMQTKTRTFLIAFVLLFDCIFCAFVLHFLCLFCAFCLHVLCGVCICLVDKCVFLAFFLHFFAFQGILW